MSNIVTVNNHDLTVLEYRGQRVITLAQVDTAHDRPNGTAGRNFREHRERFVEGTDYLRVGADEFRRHLDPRHSKFAVEDVILVTETGYTMLVKPFNDDLAWEVQRQIVTGYFAVQKCTSVAPRDLSRLEILQLAMESEQGRLIAEEQRDHAIATKAEIGSKREATAMATASAAVRRANRIAEELGPSTKHATLIRVEKATGTPPDYFKWRPLKKWCDRNGITPVKVPCPRYGEATSWPAGAWQEVYQIDLKALFAEQANLEPTLFH